MFARPILSAFGAGRTTRAKTSAAKFADLFKLVHVEAHESARQNFEVASRRRTRRQPRFDFFPSRSIECDFVTWNTSSMMSGNVRSTTAVLSAFHPRSAQNSAYAWLISLVVTSP